jgi:hypothetical protein
MTIIIGDGGGFSPLSPPFEGKSDKNDENELAKHSLIAIF